MLWNSLSDSERLFLLAREVGVCARRVCLTSHGSLEHGCDLLMSLALVWVLVRLLLDLLLHRAVSHASAIHAFL